MTIDLMHGPHFAKSYINNFLSSDVPIRIVDYRNGWGVDDRTLPTPVAYYAYEPLAMDDWPTIITVVISTTGFERIGWDRIHPIYRVSYSMRTYIWTRTEGPEETTIMRDRLSTVIRSSLMDHPALDALDPRQTFRVVIDEGSIREEYSDLTLLKGDRVLAGAYVSYDLHIDEIIMREPKGIVSEINFATQSVGPLENLPYTT
jgi:hypothetical protein